MQMGAVTRAELVAALHRTALEAEVKLGKPDCVRFMETTLEAIAHSLAAGETVKLARFGSFSVRAKRLRLGRNPKTGQTAPISARKVVTFKSSPRLRERLGKPGPH